MARLVTIKGECFEAQFENEGTGRDNRGFYYVGHLKDLARNRGERPVAIFCSTELQALIPSDRAKLKVLELNLVRRAFDDKELAFDLPSDPTKYGHLSFSASDFGPRPPASEDEIRQLLIHEAYWLGYRYNPNPELYPIQFDNPIDLDYLGVDLADIRRNLWLLGRQGLLDKTEMPGLGRPTASLIRDYESEHAEILRYSATGAQRETSHGADAVVDAPTSRGVSSGVPEQSPSEPPSAPSIGTELDGKMGEASDPLTSSKTNATTPRPSVLASSVEAAARALSDKPSVIDLLEFGDYVRALIDLIQNPKTQTPLTIGVDGAWGSGKTTLMEMMRTDLNKQRDGHPDAPTSHTVWFNAWKYDREESLWAALALEILSQVRKQLSIFERAQLWVKLNFKRLDFQKLVKYLAKSLLYPALAVLVAIACLKFWQHWISPTADLSKWSAMAVGGGILGFLSMVVKQIYNRVIAPFELNISQYVRTPDYKQRVGFLGEFETDFKFVIDAVTRGGKSSLIVFIDDLDRCEPAKPVEVIEAINHLLDADSCIFIIGMDARSVAASVQGKYKQLQDVFSDDESGTRIALGYQFLEKIIQIPFRLPKASRDMLAKLVEGNLNPQSVDATKQDTAVAETERLIVEVEREGKNLQEAAESIQRSRPEIPAAAVAEAKRNIYARTFDDDEEVRRAIYDAVPFLGQNARKIKRFINLFRLNILIANRRGLLEQGTIRAALLAKWLTIVVRWPDFADLALDQDFIKKLWEAASWRAKTLDPRAPVNVEQAVALLAPYLEDPRIKRFVAVLPLFQLLGSFVEPGTGIDVVAAAILPYAELSAVAGPLGAQAALP